MADANIFRIDAEYWIDSEGVGGPTIHHHLDRYIIADDAEVTDETTGWFEAGLEGPESAAVMNRLGLAIPEQPLSILTMPWGYIARAASTGPFGFRIWANEDKRLELFNDFADQHIPQAVEHEANAVRLEHGIPKLGADISERYLVQETQQLQAVSFNKGCYLGQEIVERIRSQGRVHRLLTPIQVSGSTPPVSGSKLVFNEAPAGEITSAAYSPAFKEVVALAYVRSEFLDKPADMLVAGMDPSVVARVSSQSVAAQL
jgi:folate-binding protein YgfZ